jgi:hypothetical protein
MNQEQVETERDVMVGIEPGMLASPEPIPEPVRGRPMSEGEYLAHVVYCYVASPEKSAEEGASKVLLEIVAARFNLDAQDLVNSVLEKEPGGRVLPPWVAGLGGPPRPGIDEIGEGVAV